MAELESLGLLGAAAYVGGTESRPVWVTASYVNELNGTAKPSAQESAGDQSGAFSTHTSAG
jgi:hypothetical protein